MPRGADDHYRELPRLPSVFKHTLLDRYVPQFAGMTGSRSDARRVVYLDGFAGRGRFEDGSPASPERILRIALHQGTNGTVAWSCFFVEAEEDSAVELVQVVDEYIRQGVTATAHHGDVLDVLDDVVGAAVGCPLFCSWIPAAWASPTSGWSVSCATNAGTAGPHRGSAELQPGGRPADRRPRRLRARLREVHAAPR
jgi:hypothetical protein